MEFLSVSRENGFATIALCRGRVNALNEPMIEEISECFRDLEEDDSIRAIILGGRGKFFSFGFDIPQFLSYSRDEFSRYLTRFCSLYTQVYLYTKPVVAALNGHTIAGGCMLALACDYRIMVKGKAKISLNEITFGSSVFAGSVEMLRELVGGKNAGRILFTGDMYSADEAERLGLIDEAVDPVRLEERVREVAGDFSGKDPVAFRSIKRLLREPISRKMTAGEASSVREFVDIWYSDETWKRLQEIKIHS